VSIYAVFPISDAADADFIAFQIPRAKLTGSSKDGDKEIIQTIPFQAIFNTAGTAVTVNTLNTTMSIQDSEVT
jgi:hypothetical protein